MFILPARLGGLTWELLKGNEIVVASSRVRSRWPLSTICVSFYMCPFISFALFVEEDFFDTSLDVVFNRNALSPSCFFGRLFLRPLNQKLSLRTSFVPSRTCALCSIDIGENRLTMFSLRFSKGFCPQTFIYGGGWRRCPRQLVAHDNNEREKLIANCHISHLKSCHNEIRQCYDSSTEIGGRISNKVTFMLEE